MQLMILAFFPCVCVCAREFMLLIDLQKSYDSIPREALWHVLQKYGIPQSMINVIRSLRDGMQAESDHGWMVRLLPNLKCVMV